MTKIPQEIQLFLDGHKPSFLPQGELMDTKIEKILEKYPKLPDEDTGGFHYFQTEKLMMSFLINMMGCSNRAEELFILGVYLGYPPKACEYFANARMRMIPSDVFIDFCGLHFGTNFNLIEENLYWLLDTYEVEESKISLQLDVRTTGERFVFKYNEKLNVAEILNEVMSSVASKQS